MTAQEKPTSVAVIGWIFLSIATLSIAAGIGSILTNGGASGRSAATWQDPSAGKIDTGKPEEDKDRWTREDPWGRDSFIFRYLENVYIVLALSMILFVSSVFFLRCKEWARKVLLGYSLAGLLWILFPVAMATYTAISKILADEEPTEGLGFIVMSIPFSLLYAGIAVVIIFVLSGKRLRSAMK